MRFLVLLFGFVTLSGCALKTVSHAADLQACPDPTAHVEADRPDPPPWNDINSYPSF